MSLYALDEQLILETQFGQGEFHPLDFSARNDVALGKPVLCLAQKTKGGPPEYPSPSA